MIQALIASSRYNPDDNDARRANLETFKRALAMADLPQVVAAEADLRETLDTELGNTRMAVTHALLACQERVSGIQLTAVRDAYTRRKPGG